MPSLTITQVAEQLRVPVPTMRQRANRLRAAGKKCGQKLGWQWVYTQRDVARLAAAGRDKNNG